VSQHHVSYMMGGGGDDNNDDIGICKAKRIDMHVFKTYGVVELECHSF